MFIIFEKRFKGPVTDFSSRPKKYLFNSEQELRDSHLVDGIRDALPTKFEGIVQLEKDNTLYVFKSSPYLDTFERGFTYFPLL